VIVARVRRTLRERALFVRGERVLVACSGGPDSAALLHVLHRLAPELDLALSAASVNHGLRPDADRDVGAARALSERLGVPFAALAVTVRGEGASLQAKAREARYEALADEARRVGASAIAVGHTMDDQAETVLGRLLRGSGVAGLAGIEPKRADGVVRPLIDCRRADVHAYAARHELPVVADPSNRDSSYERVRLRHEVVPILLREDARAVEHLARLADDARGLREFARSAAGELLAEAAVDGGLDARVLREAPAAVRAEALSRWLHESTGTRAGRAHLDAIERALASRGECLLPGGWLVRLSGRVLTIRHEPDVPTRSRRRRGSE
jgi:tRNA(Ile)-lysidine synthase